MSIETLLKQAEEVASRCLTEPSSVHKYESAVALSTAYSILDKYSEPEIVERAQSVIDLVSMI